MRWSDKQTHLFVKLYLGNKCLWDTTHEHYKMKLKRMEGYRDIVAKFHALTNILIDERVVINKIRSLRSTYSQELVKIRTRGKSSLRWFSDWHKCFQKNKKLEGRSSDDQQEGENESEDASKDWFGDEEGGDNSDLDREPLLEPTDEEEYNVLLLKQEPEIDVEPLQIPFKSKRKRKMSNSFSSDQSRHISEKSSAIDDEFDIYARYIASQLRKMDIERALRVQLQIHSLVSEARIDSLARTES